MQIEEKFGSRIIKYPELVIGLVGPIGVQLEIVQSTITNELKSLGYKTEFIKITDLMQKWEVGSTEVSRTSFCDYYKSLIQYADRFRKFCNSHSALAALAIMEIRNRRLRLNREIENLKNQDDEELRNSPIQRTAYIIRQFKLPQEVELMRVTYGRKFIQISIFLDEIERKKSIISQIKKFNTAKIPDHEAERQAIELIAIDSHEEKEEYGQRITDVFHLGDVFVLGENKGSIDNTIRRFFYALFGNNGISPSKLEYGMYTAAAAALRSIDLSRQVGAAIFSINGELKSQGCNEVPKAFGGTYWEDDETQPHRDYEEGLDANHNRKVEILHDFLTRLHDLNLIDKKANSSKEIGVQVEELMSDSIIKKSQLMDIIEFGRMVHAEMSAISDAARLGISINNSVLFCTTFPCHMCSKHIVAAGIRKVIFLEPYPKSYARDLHSDSITFNPNERDDKVLFEPFIGISPRRYRDIFEKKKRKNSRLCHFLTEAYPAFWK